MTDEITNNTIKPGYHYHVLYCITQNITIENEFIRCPLRPFSINAKLRFKTSDGLTNPQMAMNSFDDKLAVINDEKDDHAIHFKDENREVQEYDVMASDKIEALKKEHLNYKKQSIALSVGENEVKC